MSTNKEDTLRQFCDVTGADETRSRFFLESSNWQLEVALSSFYENGGNLDEAPPPAARATAPTMSDSDMDSPPVSPAAPLKKEPKRPSNPKFGTLNTLQNESSDDEEEELSTSSIIARLSEIQQHVATSLNNDEQTYQKLLFEKDSVIENLRNEIDELKLQIVATNSSNIELKEEYDKDIAKCQLEIRKLKESINREGQAFYAGGSERSGQQIIGPGKGRKDIISEMFKSVRERGAVVFEDEPSSTSRGGGAFSGAGYRLGQTNDDHVQVTPLGGNNSDTAESRSLRLCLFREGFTVDGGPVRSYTDPNNAAFLDSIRRGEIPTELAAGGAQLRVSLEDRRHEAPRSNTNTPLFTGKGHMLGSPTPPTVGATVPVTEDLPDREANLRAAQEAVKLDESQPITTVQFRLSDGSVITGRFNLTHTIDSLHEYINRAVPAYQQRTFTLCSTYPRKDLTDRQLTITAAGLANSTLLQRLN